MMQSRAPPFAAQDDLLQQPIQTTNFAQSRREEEVEGVEEVEKSVGIDMESIQAEVRPLCSNYPPASINSQKLPGVLSFTQATHHPGDLFARVTIWEDLSAF